MYCRNVLSREKVDPRVKPLRTPQGKILSTRLWLLRYKVASEKVCGSVESLPAFHGHAISAGPSSPSSHRRERDILKVREVMVNVVRAHEEGEEFLPKPGISNPNPNPCNPFLDCDRAASRLIIQLLITASLWNNMPQISSPVSPIQSHTCAEGNKRS